MMKQLINTQHRNIFTLIVFLLLTTAFTPLPAHAQTSAAQAALNRGVAAYNAGNYDQAITDFTQAIQLNPNHADAYAYRGLAYLMKEDDRAIADSEAALRIDPGNTTASEVLELAQLMVEVRREGELANAVFDRGKAAFNAGNYDLAITEFTEAIRISPYYIEAYTYRGHAYYYKNDYDHAILDFEAALRISPYDAFARLLLAEVLNLTRETAFDRGNAAYNAGNYDRAINEFTEAIRVNPNSASAYYYRGSSYYMKRDWDRAIADYENALRIDPNHTYARQYLEIARQARGR